FMIYIILASLYTFQTIRFYQVNEHVFSEKVPEIERYKFKQVAILDLAYMVTFGSELATVSILPLFFMDTFNLSAIQAGLVASVFAGLNLIMRPAGGWISDRFGRKLSLSILMLGTGLGYFLLSFITSEWSIALAVALVIFSSIFVNAGNGAVFAIIPLVKRRLTGQIAGMAGAYGNVGGVTFLTILSFVATDVFFIVIAVFAIVVFAFIALFLENPNEQMAEIMPDGTVQMIEVE
ncbi:MAG: MFS transporter, partial [Gammaproteobacteria bacterium]|nr:MFS transporter [Gammaproteobacteria bacterium]